MAMRGRQRQVRWLAHRLRACRCQDLGCAPAARLAAAPPPSPKCRRVPCVAPRPSPAPAACAQSRTAAQTVVGNAAPRQCAACGQARSTSTHRFQRMAQHDLGGRHAGAQGRARAHGCWRGWVLRHCKARLSRAAPSAHSGRAGTYSHPAPPQPPAHWRTSPTRRPWQAPGTCRGWRCGSASPPARQ